MNQCSLLGHLAPSLTSQLENLATEALLYLLQQYRTAHEAFVELVSTMGYVVPSDLEFSTQVRMQYGSIPDLVGTTSDGARVLLVESKFWAPLTSNQPTGYLRRLPSGAEGMVLFIAPERRNEELWQELADRCQREGLGLVGETWDSPLHKVPANQPLTGNAGYAVGILRGSLGRITCSILLTASPTPAR